jgi:peptidyl-prolyl cis-trans isomerase NIMA-interacting 1
MTRIASRSAVVAAILIASCDKQASQPVSPPPAPSAARAPAPSAALAPTPAAEPPKAAVQTAAPAFIAAQHLLVAYKGASAASPKITRTKEEAKKRAQEASEKAKSGSDFSQLVAEYSDEPGAAERQGNLGKFTPDKMVKPFADAAFALPVGGTSDPVETKFGFHVIRRNQ